jgi:hypothetical protein
MSPYTVDWDDTAEDDLARIWTNAADRPAVTAASAKADRLLAQDPLRYGQEVSEGLCKLDVPPLRVFYSVDSAQRSVKVSNVLPAP